LVKEVVHCTFVGENDGNLDVLNQEVEFEVLGMRSAAARCSQHEVAAGWGRGFVE
jgi:hypothetical protein